MRTAPPFLDLADDAARHVVTRQQLGWSPSLLVALCVDPAFLFVVGRLVLIELRDVIEHEATPPSVTEHAPLAAHAFRDQDAFDRRRPDHAGRVELDELHVDELGAGAIGERVAVAGVFPAVARHLERATDTTACEDYGLGREDAEAPALAVVAERADDAVAVLEQLDDGALHVHVDPRVRLAEQRLADQADADARGRRLDRRPQSGATGTDDQDVVFEGLVVHSGRRAYGVGLELDGQGGNTP